MNFEHAKNPTITNFALTTYTLVDPIKQIPHFPHCSYTKSWIFNVHGLGHARH